MLRYWYRCLITWRNLPERERLRALYDFLDFVNANPDLTTRRLRERYASLKGTSEYKVKTLERIATFSDWIYITWVYSPTLRRPLPYYRLTDLGRSIISRGRITPADYALAPYPILKSITRKPIERKEYVGKDTETGLEIWYSFTFDEYILWDPERKREVERRRDIEIEETFSIETERGHEVPLAVEINVRTRTSGKARKELEKFAEAIQTRIDEYIKRQPGWEQIKNSIRKIGLSYRFRPSSDTPLYPSSKILIEKTKPVSRRKTYPEQTVNLERWKREVRSEG